MYNRENSHGRFSVPEMRRNVLQMDRNRGMGWNGRRFQSCKKGRTVGDQRDHTSMEECAHGHRRAPPSADWVDGNSIGACANEMA